MADQFGNLQNLITNNPDGTVTIAGNTYAADGSGIIENYGVVSDEQQALNADAQAIADTTSGQNTFLESQGYVYDPRTKSYGPPSQEAPAAQDAIDAQAAQDAIDAQAAIDAQSLQATQDAIDNPPSTAQEIADALTARGLESSGNFFLQGSSSLDDITARYGGDESFMDLVNRYDPSTMSEFEGNYTYNPRNQDFGAGSGRNRVYYLDPTTGQAATGFGSEVNALYPGVETYAGIDAFTAANSDPNLFNPIGNTTVDIQLLTIPQQIQILIMKIFTILY